MVLITRILIGVAIVLLAAAALLTMVRLVKGPSALDRVLSVDVLVAIIVASVAIEEVINGNTTGLPVIMALSVVGFTGSVGMAKLMVNVAGQRERYRESLAKDKQARAEHEARMKEARH